MKYPIAGLLLLVLLLPSCKKKEFDPYPHPTITEFKGKFEQSIEDQLPLEDIGITSVTDEAFISGDGSFEIESVENLKYQIFMVTSKNSGEIIYYGISEPGTGEVLINDSTTALGLFLLNPYLFGSEQEQRKQYLDQVKKETKFPQLIEKIGLARDSNPDDPLNLDENPDIYQLLGEILMSSMEKLGNATSGSKYGEKLIEIYDGQGNDVYLRNYRHIFYAADISYNPYEKIAKSLSLSRREKVVEWVWWPLSEIGPRVTSPPQTKVNIDDGNVKFEFYSFTGLEDDDKFNAKEQATVLNILYSIAYGLDMIAGVAGEINDKLAYKNLVKLLMDTPEFINIGYKISEGDTPALFNSVLSLMVSKKGMSIIKDYLNIDVNDIYIECAQATLKTAIRFLTALGYLNEHIPFFVDLVRGPSYTYSYYTSTNGKLALIKDNRPPEVVVKTFPSIGYKETEVTFTAEYIDDYTPADNALYEWKWVDEGSEAELIPWSDPSSNSDTVLTLSGPGTIHLRVNDRMEGEDSYVKHFPFYESVEKNRIILLSGCNLSGYYNSEILQDSLGYCWDYWVEGPLTYKLTNPGSNQDLPGEEFSTSILNPGTDLLVIDIDDFDFFRDEVMQEYMDNRLAILNFVKKGGNLLFITSYNHEYESNFLPLPVIASESDAVRKGVYSNLEFIEGSQAAISTQFAFDEIPDDALVHLTNSSGKPLLAEIKYGQGNIICSIFITSYYCTTSGDDYYPFHYPANLTPFKYLIGAIYK